MEQRRRWADITDEEVDTLWAAAPRAAGLPRAVAPRRPRPSSTACRPPASAHDRSNLWQPLAPLCLGRCDGEPRCNFAAESASVFAAAPFAQLCSTLLGLGMGFPLEPRLADVLRAEAPESELGWKLYRLLLPRNVRAEAYNALPSQRFIAQIRI